MTASTFLILDCLVVADLYTLISSLYLDIHLLRNTLKKNGAQEIRMFLLTNYYKTLQSIVLKAMHNRLVVKIVDFKSNDTSLKSKLMQNVVGRGWKKKLRQS